MGTQLTQLIRPGGLITAMPEIRVFDLEPTQARNTAVDSVDADIWSTDVHICQALSGLKNRVSLQSALCSV